MRRPRLPNESCSKLLESWIILTEVRTTSSTGGEKGVKPERYDLIPVEALAKVARLYGFGAQKYEAHNWRRGYEWSKSYAAMQRHSNEFWQGIDLDPETGLPNLAGVVFHALTLMTFMDEQPKFDDRFIGPKTEVEAMIDDMNRGVISKEEARQNFGLAPEIVVNMANPTTLNEGQIYKQAQDQLRLAHRSSQL